MKVAVCNSVGIDAGGSAMIHSPSRWTNSSNDLNVFTYYPWQLAYCSSILKRDTDQEIKFFDGCLHKLDHQGFVDQVSEFGPDYLVMDCATRTIEADAKFAREVKKRFGTKLIICGPHATTFPEEVAEWADYVVRREYELTIRDIIQGKDPNDILGLYPNRFQEPLDVNHLPLPEDDDVSRLDYGIPGEPSSEYLEIQAYASRGCPLSCSFCVCGNISYARPNWRPRKPENVIHELDTLRAKYPRMEGIFFDEEVHNGSKKYMLELTKAIRDAGHDDLKYDVMCGLWPMDEEVLDAMRGAGYYMVRLGIETTEDLAAAGMELGTKFNPEKLKRLLKYGTNIGMKFYGTFTFGGEGSTDAGDKQTIRLIRELIDQNLLWRFQLSISTPQPGTPFYNRAKEGGYLKEVDWKHFDGGNFCVVDQPQYPASQVEANHREAEKLYDIAFKNRYFKSAQGNLDSLELEAPKEILVFRCSRMWQVDGVINALQKKFPKSKISVLGQPEVAEKLKQNHNISETFFYDNSHFDNHRFPQQLINQLRNRRFALGVIPYNNMTGNGYKEVATLARKMDVQKLVGINIQSKVFELSNGNGHQE
ncbi:MAG: radical SAM protein [Nitrospinota bacterium]|nr:radical SAM protein [Nitrospinota bacterium]